MTKQRVILPTHLKPHNYQLSLIPDFSTFKFTGQEVISLSAHVDSFNSITLNCLEIEIDQQSVQLIHRVSNSLVATCKSCSYDDKKQSVVIELSETVSVQSQVEAMNLSEYLLKFSFVGELNDKMCGFYRSQYSDPQTGEKKWMATTQFEAADARRAFPCFDEPALKATFDVTLTVPKDLVALSCMPVISDTDLGNGFKKITYDTTPVMSTYLLAFVIGEFDYIEKLSKDNKIVRVYTPRGKTELGKFALDVAVFSLEFFTDLFDFPYPISKMDLIAVPDFASGAMENYGLITYRETRLLIDPKESSQATKQATARTVAHEVAHMWYGNLVTPNWWSMLWLKEGFARFLEFLSVDNLFPDWGAWTQFVQEVFGTAQNLDSLKSSHPIEVEVADPGEISEIFDSISYAKGGSVNRMLGNWIGNHDMKIGLRSYIKKYAYKTTSTEDLWACFEEASGKPVKKVMDTFVKQTGYPVLIIESRPVSNGVEIHAKQQRFLIDGSTDDQLWSIPIRITTKKHSLLERELEEYTGHPLFLLTEREQTFVIEGISEDDWIKVNSNQAGFYRVQYSKPMLQKLALAVREGELTDAADRIGLISDVFALAKAGYATAVDCLELLESFKLEVEYPVWAEISDNVGTIDLMLRDEELEPKLDQYARAIFKSLFLRFGWESKPDERHLDSLFRSTIISKLLGANDPQLIAEAQDLFNRYVKGAASISPDLRFAVYKSVVQNGGEPMYNQVLKIYDTAESQEEKTRALRAVCYTKDPQLIERTISFVWSDNIRKQDIIYPISSLALNMKSREASWQYVKENWAKIFNSYGAGHIMLGHILSGSASYFVTEEKAKEVDDFYNSNQDKVNGIERAYHQTVERIRYKAEFVKRERSNVLNWLNKVF